MPQIERLHALEILDSRGRPTVQATCHLQGGTNGTVSVPSGASTGAGEALELRDGDPARYGGLGCLRAVENVNVHLQHVLAGRNFENQEELDQALCDADGTTDKSNLGANAILAVSLAYARACATATGVDLYQYFATLLRASPSPATATLSTLPRLTVNLFSGGKHAGGQVAIQDVLIVPARARTISDALVVIYAVYQAAAQLCAGKYGMRLLTADEGGLAPPFPSTRAMLSDAVQSIAAAGFKPGHDVMLAIDVASTHFYSNEHYHLDGRTVNSGHMIQEIRAWCNAFPIVSVEDGLAEDDWEHWPALTDALAEKALVLGDDLLCTNPVRIERAIKSGAATALLLKVNQIGTLTEAAKACHLARSAGWRVTISARSGETEDNWLADLAVGWQGDQLKVGSITQSDRLAKYNRLLAIEDELSLPVVQWPSAQADSDPGA